MFKFKQCKNCGSKNKKHHEHCTSCGDKLITNAKFGKNVFAVTLSAVILLFAVTAFASKSYINYKANKAVPPVTDTKTTEQAPTIQQTPEVTAKPITTTPPATTTPKTTTKPVTTTTQTAQPITTTPVITCDEGKKYSAIDVETIAYNGYVQYENTRYNNMIEIIRHQCDSTGTSGNCSVLTAWANEDKKHADNLAQLEATHTAKLAEINARCY